MKQIAPLQNEMNSSECPVRKMIGDKEESNDTSHFQIHQTVLPQRETRSYISIIVNGLAFSHNVAQRTTMFLY